MKDDTISRAAALDFIDSMNWCDEISDEAFKKITIHLENLPSAQPKFDEWCDDCKEYDRERHSCPRWNRVIRETVDDMEAAQPGWIPWDSGELPKESGWYIVTAYDGRTSRTTFAKYQKRLKRWDLTGARAYWRVLAWRPLPEPAKIEG